MAGGNASAAVQQAAEDASATMQAALASLKDSRDASCPPASLQQVQSAVQLLRMEVAKTGLLYSQQQPGSSPTDEEAKALLRGFQQVVCTLCMLYTAIAAGGGRGGGPTLRQSLYQTATSVVEACVALTRGAVVGGARDSQLMMLSGFCLEMLEAAEKAPLDSRTAIGRAIMLVLKQLTDAQKELDEAIQEAEAAAAEVEAGADTGEAAEADQGSARTAGAAAANGSTGGGAMSSKQQGEQQQQEQEAGEDREAEVAAASDEASDVGFGFEDEEFTAEQLAVAVRVRGMLAATVGVVRSVVKLLLAEREGLDAEGVEGWESMLYHVRTLGPLCDDLAAAAYPPQDAEELASAAEALATSCQLLMDECPQPGTATSAAGGGAEGAEAAAGSTAGDGTTQEQQHAQQGAQHQQQHEKMAAALREAMSVVQQAHGELMRQLGAGANESETA